MKKCCLIVLTTLLVMSCSFNQNEKVTRIKGEVLSGNAKEVKFEWITDNPISGHGNTYIAEIDSNSNFSIEIPVKRIATGRISVGGFYHDICLLPGDDFFISVDGDTIKYSGKGANKNNYLYQAEINGVWDRAYSGESNAGKLSPADLLESLKMFKQNRINFFESYMDSVKLQKEFVDFYKIETEVIFETIIQQYPSRYSYMTGIPHDSMELSEEYIKLNWFSHFVDDAKVISYVYVSNLRNQLYTKANEISLADTSLNWRDAIYVALFDSLQGKTREYVLTDWIISELSRDVYDSVAVEKFNEIEKDELAQSTFVEGLNKFIEKRSLINQPLHTEFSSSQLIDTSGVHLTFGEMMDKYKGKVVYLDFWGMGCSPCRAAMPYSKMLKEKLENLPIEFVYISLQWINQDDWDTVFEATFTEKNHYFFVNGFDSRLYKFMEINWVPCYMLFDKEGKLIDFNADRPSKMIEMGETQLERTLKDIAMK